MDQPSAGCSGPSSGDPVNLSTGEEEYRPAADITVYNPTGPSVVWKRSYYSLSAGNNTEDFGFGWVNNYAYKMYADPTKSTNNINLIYPNGSTVVISGMAPTPTKGTACTVPPGYPFTVNWYYITSTQVQLVVTYRNHTSLVFRPTPIGGGLDNQDGSTYYYSLAFLLDRNGHALGFHYGAANASYARYSLNAITNDSNTQLLTVQRDHTTNAITSVTTVADDVVGSSTLSRSVYYSNVLVGTPTPKLQLQSVSQVLDTGTYNTQNPQYRFQYRYTTTFGAAPGYNSTSIHDGYVFLSGITVPSPTGSGTDTATIQYDDQQYVGQLTDANGYTRTYTSTNQFGTPAANSNYTQVSVLATLSGSSNPYEAPYTYISGYDANMSSSYTMDANGILSSTGGWDPNDPYRPTSIQTGNELDEVNINNEGFITVVGNDFYSTRAGKWEIYKPDPKTGVPTLFESGSRNQKNSDGYEVDVPVGFGVPNVLFITVPKSALNLTHLELRANFPGSSSTPSYYGSAYFDVYSTFKTAPSTHWDKYGNLTSFSDARNTNTLLSWDTSHFALGDLAAVSDGYTDSSAAKTPWTVSYLDNSTHAYRNGLITAVSTPIPGNSNKGGTGPTQTSYFYYDESGYAGSDNNLGLLTTEQVPGNSTTPYIYSHWNYTTDNAYNATGGAGTYSKSAGTVGEPLVYTNNDGKQTHYRYDLRGNCTIVIDAVGNETDYGYNAANQLVRMVQYSPQPAHAYVTGTYLSYLYVGGPLAAEQLRNSSGTPIREVDFAYGHEGELLSESAVNFSVMTGGSYQKTLLASYLYDGLYHVIASTEGNGSKTEYTYSSASGRLSGIQYPSTIPAQGSPNTSGRDTVQMTAYDAEGNLLQLIDGNGAVTNYSYDQPDSQLSQISYSYPAGYPGTQNTEKPTFTYDNYSRLASVTDIGIPQETFSYDDLDELVQKQFSYSASLQGLTVGYTYNPDGSRAGMSVPVPGLSGNTGYFRYAYDDLGRMTGMVNPLNDETDWTYQANDWLASQSDYFGSPSANANLIDRQSYTYDPRGLIATLLDQGTVNYPYPIAQYGSTQTPMLYDAAGNRTSMPVSDPAYNPYSGTTSYTYDYKDELTQEATTRNGGSTNNYAYDAAGNSQLGTLNSDDQYSNPAYWGYDGDGNITDYSNQPATYDINDHLTGFTAPGQSQVTAATTSDGLRVSRSQGGNSTYYVYDGDTPVVELTGGGGFAALNSFGPDGLVSRETGTAATAKHFYVYDPQGSPAAVLDGSGSTIGASDPVTAYGILTYATAGLNVTSDPYTGFGSQWGYYRDWSTALELLGQRYYDVNLGRFINRDPGGLAGGPNLYEYADDNPVNNIDPSGLYPAEDDGGSTDLPTSLGGLYLGMGGEGAGQLLNNGTFTPGSEARSDISNDVQSIPVAGSIYSALVSATGCDYIAGAPVPPVQRALGALGVGGELAGLFRVLTRCEGGACFVAGTPVQMADGTTKPIEQVKPGDLVESRDPATGKTEVEEVIGSESHLSGQTMTLTLSDGERIECTPQHRFFVEGQGFVDAGKLTRGDALEYGEEDGVSHKPLTLTVSHLNLHPEATSESTATRVYNFTVANTHTYFVGTAHDGVWVHNAGLLCSARTWINHILPRHGPGTTTYPGKSKFAAGINLGTLLNNADTLNASRSGNGLFVTTTDAGVTVGYDRNAGANTSLYTVVFDVLGNVITMYPGRP